MKSCLITIGRENVFWKTSFFILTVLLTATVWLSADISFAQVQQNIGVVDIEIPSSFNPVGSGARALGMGGAFIAVADDATAASWNPGGLIQLEHPEMSAVMSFIHRKEDIAFGTNPESDGSHSISEENINYFSITCPFLLFNHNMVVSLSYQHLYDFTRDWNFSLHEEGAIPSGDQPEGLPPLPDMLYELDTHLDYLQEGKLTALGASYCLQITPTLSAGITLNFWKDGLTDNNWKQTYRVTKTGTLNGIIPFSEEDNRVYEYSLSGFNANLGLLWEIKRLTLGAVFKTPFTADLEYKLQRSSPSSPVSPEFQATDAELEMPMSYGMGLAYRFSDVFSLSADIYRTEWDDFILKNKDGSETSPVTGHPVDESDISPTHQAGIGAEYLLMNINRGYVISLRGGIFYDPAPARGNPDDFYGFSLGMGFTKMDWFSLDIAYQFRFGNDVGKSLLEDQDFSQDVAEHKVYVSLIWYKF